MEQFCRTSGLQREQWTNWFQFMSVNIGYIFGIRSIWIFPYHCFSYGGVAYLFIYVICNLLFGLPMIFVEMWFSCKANLSPGGLWKACPLFKGLGFSMVVYTAIISIYYNVLSGWSLFYFVNSFLSPLPWATCDGIMGLLCYNKGEYGNITFHEYWYTKRPAKIFHKNNVDVNTSLEHLGSLKWQLVLSLMVAWILVFLFLMKGTRIYGKISFILIVVIMLIFSTLTIRVGCLDGVKYGFQWLKTEFKYDVFRNRIHNVKAWVAASNDVLFTFGLGQGCLGTVASYSRFDTICARDAIILMFVNISIKCLTTVFVYMTYGYVTAALNMAFSGVIDGGDDLVFIDFVEALASIRLPQVWTVLYFIMILLLLLSTQAVHVLTVVSAVVENFPRTNTRKYVVVIVVCLVGFLLGLPCVTEGGRSVLNFLDQFAYRMSYLIVIMELIIFAFLYGAGRYNMNMYYPKQRTFSKGRIFKIVMCSIIAIIPLLMWIYNVKDYYGKNVADTSVRYPRWANGVGWIIAILPIIPIPCGMMYTLIRKNGTLLQRFQRSLKPEFSWKPPHYSQEQNDSMENEEEDMDNLTLSEYIEN